MRRKCEACQGKGTWVEKGAFITIVRSCHQCKGKGKWWPNQRPKQKRAK